MRLASAVMLAGEINRTGSGDPRATAGRRTVLRLGVATALNIAAGPVLAAVAGPSARSLALHNLHTEETVRATYWVDGTWQAEGLARFDHLLRDFRTGDVIRIDPGLLDLMHRLATGFGVDRPIEVFSGYRSPRTNAQLARRSSGVARNSLHTQGKAVDLRLPGVPLADLRRAALSLRAGGVGYYPRSGFVHIDTGRVRFW